MTANRTIPGDRSTAAIAAVSALLMIAWQVGAKAARDAVFLTWFDVERLPVMVICGALLSLAAIRPATDWMNRLGPGRFLPRAFLASGFLTLAIWGLYSAQPRVAAVLLYLQVASVGALLVSVFWSLANEAFDPRSGKHYFVWITRAATLGGLIGSVLADRAAEWLSLASFLPVLAALHFATATLVSRLDPQAASPPAREADQPGSIEVLKTRPYLRSLALLIVVITASSGIIDYIFKAGVAERYNGEDLLQFFAWFYMAVGVGAVLLQGIVARPLLKTLGITRTAAVLPVTVAIGGVASLLAPGLGSAATLRGVDSALQNSTHRLAYELLYVPVSRHDKRRIKAIIDVGMNRLGDVIGAIAVSAVLLVFVTPNPVLLTLVIGLALGAAFIASRLERGYLDALERSLRSQAGRVEGAFDIPEGMARTMVSEVLGSADLSEVDPELLRRIAGVSKDRPQTSSDAPHGGDPRLRQIEDLRSGDVARVTAVLSGPLTPDLVGHVIPLLAWDEVVEAATRALADTHPPPTGQLIDALLDPEVPFAVRRRLPRVFGPAHAERGARGLIGGLADQRFEVRYRCGQALVCIQRALPSLALPQELVFKAVFDEARTSRSVWASRTLIDADEEAAPVSGILRDRSDRSMHHVFSLLSLVLPSESLGIAFRGLNTNDARLRGTALEYLEKVLPTDIRKVLWPFLEPGGVPPRSSRPVDEVLDELVRSHQSLRIDIARLRGAPPAEE